MHRYVYNSVPTDNMIRNLEIVEAKTHFEELQKAFFKL